MRVWLFSAAAFFGLVILYFLGGKYVGQRAGFQPPPTTAPLPPLEPAASPLPTSDIRMRIKRIEPRKYRREGDLPPPPSVR